MTQHPHDGGDHLYQRVIHDFAQMGLEVTDWFHHPTHPSQAGDTTMHIASLTDGLIHDLEAAGHTVTQDMRGIIERRHGIVSVLTHTADYMNRIQGSAWAPLFERYAGLDPAVVATAVHVVDVIAADGARMLAGPAAAPAVPPAEPQPAA